MIGGWGSKCHMFTVLNMKSEIFGENLKIQAGSDDKQQIQFAPPKIPYQGLIQKFMVRGRWISCMADGVVT